MPLVAEPWVKPDDYGLRADIQRLADAGVINSPVTTYPLMWKSFIGEVRSMPLEKLSPSLQDAILRVKNRYSSENNSAHNFHVDAYVSSDTRTVTSFGAANTQETELLTSYSYMGENFAAKVAVNHRDNGKKCYVTGKTQTDIASNEQALEDCDDTSFDHSYIAYRLGNWILRAGAIEQFWGPGVDNSLIMSTNAKPLPALSITREQSSAFETPR
ncbi:MAG: capsule assembly Wzi family protein, partial [Pseudoalteromonas sp.]